MIHFVYKRDFLKAFDSLSRAEQKLFTIADEEIRSYCEGRRASFGLRIRKLYENRKNGQVFEARASRALRILWTKQENQITFVILGNHNIVKNYLKNL